MLIYEPYVWSNVPIYYVLREKKPTFAVRKGHVISVWVEWDGFCALGG